MQEKMHTMYTTKTNAILANALVSANKKQAKDAASNSMIIVASAYLICLSCFAKTLSCFGVNLTE